MATQPHTQGLYEHTKVTTPGEDTQHVVEVDKVQVNLFFDGTFNNYYNVTTEDAGIRRQYGGEHTSYDNGMSNVARMWSALHKDRDSPDLGIYIDGMGTTRLHADSLRGAALGTGDTGVRARAQQALESLISAIKRKRRNGNPPAVLELNLFGFSRGAATARHFASLLRQREEIAKHFLDEWGHVLVQVNFVGLFDTVSAEGAVHRSDVEQLGLRFVDDSARRVFQLVALDEYRVHFALTTIDSACRAKTTVDGIRQPMGFELGIPGSHSDVGGGYKAGTAADEPPETMELPPTRQTVDGDGSGQTARGPQSFVYAQGWYAPEDLKAGVLHPYRHQRQVGGDYYKVGLSLMVDVAERCTTTMFPTSLKADMQARTPDIAEVQAQLRELARQQVFAAAGGTRASRTLEELLGREKARAFRRAYLHVSLRADYANQPRYKNDTELERQHVPG